MLFIYSFFTLITFLSVFLDAFFYPTFTLEHIGIDAIMILLSYATGSIILRDYLPNLPKKFKIFHKKLIFPILVAGSASLLILEHMNKPNFVFSHFHIHPFLFLYIPILSAIIIFIPRLRVEKEFLFFLYAPLIFLLVMHSFSVYFPSIFSHLVKEDGTLEDSQFLLFLLSSIISFLTSRKLWNGKKSRLIALIFLALGLGLFFVAGEEISWGQRFFHVATPESVKEVNVQGEITVHNLRYFQYALPFLLMLGAAYAAFSRLIAERFLKKLSSLHIFTPPYFMMPTFIFILLFYYEHTYAQYMFASIKYLPHTIFPQLWDEVIETVIAFNVLGYAYYAYKTTNKKTVKK